MVLLSLLQINKFTWDGVAHSSPCNKGCFGKSRQLFKIWISLHGREVKNKLIKNIITNLIRETRHKMDFQSSRIRKVITCDQKC